MTAVTLEEDLYLSLLPSNNSNSITDMMGLLFS